MIARRLLLLAAVLMLLTVVAGGLAPTEESPTEPGPRSLPDGTTVVKRITADPAASTQVAVRRGDLLELEVEGEMLDSVLIERLDRIEAMDPTTPARFNLLIEARAGSYPIRLVEADRRIGSLVVSD